MRAALALEASDVYYAPLPLFHIAGQWAVVYAALMSGGAAVIKERFSVSEFWADVEKSQATVSFLLGAMANFLQGQPPSPADKDNALTRLLMSPLVPELAQFRERFGVKVATAYGSTECNVPILSDFSIDDPRQCGRARDGWEVAILDQDDEPVEQGEAGEIAVRPPEPWLTMKGYLGNPSGSAEAYRNCWLHTGDIAFADECGNFYFVDRKNDAIRRRGENISSFEVEREVNAHSAVLESAAVGVASEHTEEEVLVFVVLNEDGLLRPAGAPSLPHRERPSVHGSALHTDRRGAAEDRHREDPEGGTEGARRRGCVGCRARTQRGGRMSTEAGLGQDATQVRSSTIAEDLASFTARLDYEMIPDSAIHFAKALVVKTVAASLGGSGSPSAAAFAAHVNERGLPQEVGAIGFDFRTALWEGVLLNIFTGHNSELEDVAHSPGGVSWDITVIPLVLALGEKLHLSGRSALEAIVAGLEVHTGPAFHSTLPVSGWSCRRLRPWDVPQARRRPTASRPTRQQPRWVLDFRPRPWPR